QGAPLLVHKLAIAEKILHVMAHLVGDDVGLGKLRLRTAEPPLEFVKEGWIQINGPVRGTVEGANGRRRSTAARVDLLREQHHVRRLITSAGLAELVVPHDLGEAQDRRREVMRALFLGGWSALLLHRSAWPPLVE